MPSLFWRKNRIWRWTFTFYSNLRSALFHVTYRRKEKNEKENFQKRNKMINRSAKNKFHDTCNWKNNKYWAWHDNRNTRRRHTIQVSNKKLENIATKRIWKWAKEIAQHTCWEVRSLCRWVASQIDHATDCTDTRWKCISSSQAVRWPRAISSQLGCRVPM